LLAGISLPKLAVAFTLLVLVPGLTLGTAPILVAIWFGKLSMGWRNGAESGSARDWRASLERIPLFGNKPAATIDVTDVKASL
jgi:hypothetical protein